MELGHLLFTIFSAFFGLAVGSFLNVCIYRIPKGTFFTEKHSYCPKCGQPLKWYDMVPVFSWIFLGGKCRNCKEKISARYPIVESLNAVLWTLSAYFIGLNANAFIYDALFSALIVMTFIDIDTKEIPNGIVVFIIILSIPLFFTAKDVVWWHRLVGAVVISVPLYVIALVTGGIGGGDIKLYFALGLVLGLYPTLVSAFIAIVSAGLTQAPGPRNRRSHESNGPGIQRPVFHELHRTRIQQGKTPGFRPLVVGLHEGGPRGKDDTAR